MSQILSQCVPFIEFYANYGCYSRRNSKPLSRNLDYHAGIGATAA